MRLGVISAQYLPRCAKSPLQLPPLNYDDDKAIDDLGFKRI